ncbi:MAG TPA: response regulator [Holophaga sp.]|nr:response regulator [Holophaga sp.]
MAGRTRILFVDDEPLVLQALERLLRGMRGEWEMAFAQSGTEALDLMARAPFDVVVADIGMPGMTGTVFLGHVMRRHPEVVRLVLSGQADVGQVLQAEGVAHQFMAKPCDPETLRAVIRSATAAAAHLRSQEIRRVLGGIRHLPVLPSAYQEILGLLEQEDAKATDIGRVVQKDPGMTANLLKVVNSAYFGLRQRVSDPADAVAYLGVETLKALALVHGVFQQAGRFPEGFNGSRLWAHCLQMGLACREVARVEKLPREAQADAFTGGLLHDVGLLILAAGLPDRYGAVGDLLAEGHDILAAEMQVLGVHHGEVGAHLLGMWGLPAPVVEAVATHHAPPLLDPLTPASIVACLEGLLCGVGDAGVFGLCGPGDPARFRELLGPRAEAWTGVLEGRA